MAEVVHLGDRLLAAVAALGEVHGRAQPVELVRDRASRRPRSRRAGARPRCAAPRGRGCRRRAARRVRRAARARRAPRGSSTRRTDASAVAYWCPPRLHGGPRVDPDERHAVRGGRRRGRIREGADRREVGRAVGDLDAQHEAHPVEQGGEARAGAGVDEQPGGLAVVDHADGVLDATGRVEQQGLGRLARLRGRAIDCEVSESSQLSRSGPVTVTTSRSERSTIAAPGASARCSPIGLP